MNTERCCWRILSKIGIRISTPAVRKVEPPSTKYSRSAVKTSENPKFPRRRSHKRLRLAVRTIFGPKIEFTVDMESIKISNIEMFPMYAAKNFQISNIETTRQIIWEMEVFSTVCPPNLSKLEIKPRYLITFKWVFEEVEVLRGSFLH